MSWQRTDLSTDPPSIQMADTDTKAIAIDAGETVTGVTVEIVDLDAPGAPLPGLATAVVNGTSNGAVVTITGLTRGETYELSTVFSRADGTTWTKTTVIRCVA